MIHYLFPTATLNVPFKVRLQPYIWGLLLVVSALFFKTQEIRAIKKVKKEGYHFSLRESI